MSRFLAQPELFPARLAGEPWGTESVTLDLPGGPFAILGLSAEQRDSLLDRFEAGSGAPGVRAGGLSRGAVGLCGGRYARPGSTTWTSTARPSPA